MKRSKSWKQMLIYSSILVYKHNNFYHKMSVISNYLLVISTVYFMIKIVVFVEWLIYYNIDITQWDGSYQKKNVDLPSFYIYFVIGCLMAAS